MKIQLEQKKFEMWDGCEIMSEPLKESEPFFKSRRGEFVHRIKNGNIHQSVITGHTHTSISFWCGNTGFLSKGDELSRLPKGEKHCKCCKERYEKHIATKKKCQNTN